MKVDSTVDNADGTNIGTLNESPLHADLKRLVAEPGDRLEQTVDGYVVDILRGNSILEIQTANFAAIRRKVAKLLDQHAVRLVHPIAHERWIIKTANATRRKSPKRQGLEACFWELVSIPTLLKHERFELELVLIQEEEVREPARKRYYRRQQYRVIERRLVSVLDRLIISSPQDLLRLLPIPLPDTFTTRDISSLTGWPLNVSQRAAYVLHKTGVIIRTDKKGNAFVYVLGQKPAG